MALKFHSNAVSARLSIDGYEFLEEANNKFDANWLIVRIEYVFDSKVCIRRAPRLLTWELVRIYEAFHDLELLSKLEFMEPELELSYNLEKGAILHVGYGMRFKNMGMEEYWTGPLSKAQRLEYCDCLAEMCKSFPVRNHRNCG